MNEKLKAKPLLGITDTETVMLDFDSTPFKKVKYWASRIMKYFSLEGFLVLKSSKNSYHIVFNRKVSWTENVRIMAWACLESCNERLVKWFLLQCRKEESTLRVSAKGKKPSPRIVYRCGRQDAEIRNYIRHRSLIKSIIRKLRFKEVKRND